MSAPRLSPRWSQLGRCPACGLAISVDEAGAPNGEHVGSRLCRELAAERAAKRAELQPCPRCGKPLARRGVYHVCPHRVPCTRAGWCGQCEAAQIEREAERSTS